MTTATKHQQTASTSPLVALHGRAIAESLKHRSTGRPSVCTSRRAYTQSDSLGGSSDAASVGHVVTGPIHLLRADVIHDFTAATRAVKLEDFRQKKHRTSVKFCEMRDCRLISTHFNSICKTFDLVQFLRSLDMWFPNYASRQTERQTDRQARRNTPLPYRVHTRRSNHQMSSDPAAASSEAGGLRLATSPRLHASVTDAQQ